MRYLAFILLAFQVLGAMPPRIRFNAATTNDVPPYMWTNANLVALQAFTPNSWQATNGNLTLLQAYGPNAWQATNANLTLLQAYNPSTWQHTNANLTLWQALHPTNKQDAFDTNLFVQTVEQPLTDAQKTVVKVNVGAADFKDSAGFPELRGKTNIVFTGPYTTPAAGTNFGMSGPVSAHVEIDFINTGDNARVWNDTRVRQVSMVVPAALPATAEVYVDFWRIASSDNRCDFVGSSGNIRSLLTADGSTNLVDLPTPVDVKMGDVTGGHIIYDGVNWGAGFVVASATTNDVTRFAYTVTLQDGTPWFAPGVATIPGYLIPISVYGDAPVFTMFGDSRIDGYPYSNCLTKGGSAWGGHWDADADPANLVGKLTGLSIRNEGRAGFDTGEMESRIADVTASGANWYIFCTGYYNDIYASRTQAQFLASCTNIINTLLATGAKVIVVPDFPFKDSQYLPASDTDIQNEVSDIWMGVLEEIVWTYYDHESVLWADTRPYMGQLRPDTGGAHWHDYNRWDLIELFRYNAVVVGAVEPGSVDSLHWSAAGEEAAARAIVAEVRPKLKAHGPMSLGIGATVDVLVNGSTTNRLVFSSGILISNIATFHE